MAMGRSLGWPLGGTTPGVGIQGEASYQKISRGASAFCRRIYGVNPLYEI